MKLCSKCCGYFCLLLTFESVRTKTTFTYDDYIKMAMYSHSHEKNIERAQFYCNKAIELDPFNWIAYSNLASLATSNSVRKKMLYKVLEVAPNNIDAVSSLGYLLECSGNAAEAIRLYEKALDAQPNSTTLKILLATACPPVFNSTQEAKLWHSRLHVQIDCLKHSSRNLYLSDPLEQVKSTPWRHAYQGYNNKEFLEMLHDIYRLSSRKLNYVSPLLKYRESNLKQKIRVGVVSEFYLNTSPAKLLKGLLLNLNKDKFDVVLFRREEDDDITQTIGRSNAIEVHTLPYNFDKSIDIIAEARIDFLLFAAVGIDPLSYFLTFARLAPIQAIFGHGHPITSGVSSIDYFISSELFEFGDYHPQNKFTEQYVQFSTSTTYFYKLSDVFTRNKEYFGFSANSNLYACLQHKMKFHPSFDSILKDILEQDSKAIILLLKSVEKKHIHRFQSVLSKEQLTRINFLPQMSSNAFLELLGVVDVMLDTFPWGGGITSFEGFHLCIPQILLPLLTNTTLQLALGQYRQLNIENIEDLVIGTSKQDYVTKAVRIATDKDLQVDLKKKICAAKDRLFENEKVIIEWESFIQSSLKMIL